VISGGRRKEGEGKKKSSEPVYRYRSSQTKTGKKKLGVVAFVLCDASHDWAFNDQWWEIRVVLVAEQVW